MNHLEDFLNILLIEDDPADVKLTLRILNKSELKLNIDVVNDGVDAINFLEKSGSYSKAVTPDIILLDLNLPKKDGREVLEEIRKKEDLKKIPVIILTTSQAEEDIAKSYELNANCYISKPVDLNQFTKVIKSIEEFWLSIAKLPKG